MWAMMPMFRTLSKGKVRVMTLFPIPTAFLGCWDLIPAVITIDSEQKLYLPRPSYEYLDAS